MSDPSAPPPVPAGMVIVTRDRFFDLLRADQRDIMPSVREPSGCVWETSDREVWGWSSPGWRDPGRPRAYAVLAHLVPDPTA